MSSQVFWPQMLATSRLARGLAAVLVAVLAWYVLRREFHAFETTISNLIMASLCILSIFMFWRASQRDTEDRLAWRIFMIGGIAWYIGQMGWTVGEAIGTGPVPVFSFTSIFNGIFSPIMLVGFVLLIRRHFSRIATVESVLDSIIVVNAIALLFYETTLQPWQAEGNFSTTQINLMFVWQVSTAILPILGVVTLLLRPDLLWRGPWLLLTIGFAGFAVANFTYSELVLKGEFQTGSFADFGWLIGLVCMSLAGYVASRDESDHRATLTHQLEQRSAVTRLLLTVVSVLMFTMMAIYIGGKVEPDVTILGLLAFTGFVLAGRLGYAVMQTSRLAQRTRERDRLVAVVESATFLTSSLDLGELTQHLARNMASAVDRRYCEVYLYSQGTDTITAMAYSGIPQTDIEELKIKATYHGQHYSALNDVLRTLEPAEVRTSDSTHPTPVVEIHRRMGRMTSLLVPIVVDDQVLGLIATWSPWDPTPFDPEDIYAARAIGRQAGLAIRNARLLEQSRRHANEQESLLRVSQAAVSSLKLSELLDEIARAALSVGGIESCEIETWNPGDDFTVLVGSATIDEWPGHPPINRVLPLDLWPSSRRVLFNRETLNLPTDSPELTPEEQKTLSRSGTGAFLEVPLVVGDEAIGIMALYSRRHGTFSDDEVRLAVDIAAQTALAMDRARLVDALKDRADTDGLTNILNHRAVVEALDMEAARTRREHTPTSIMIIDMDAFKQINDIHGHLVGDEMLRETTRFLRAQVRELDYVGRYGGDEFLLVLPNTDLDDARMIVTRLLNAADDFQVVIHNLVFPLRFSAGIATAPYDGDSREDLLLAADSRLYEMKAARRWLTSGITG